MRKEEKGEAVFDISLGEDGPRINSGKGRKRELAMSGKLHYRETGENWKRLPSARKEKPKKAS